MCIFYNTREIFRFLEGRRDSWYWERTSGFCLPTEAR